MLQKLIYTKLAAVYSWNDAVLSKHGGAEEVRAELPTFLTGDDCETQNRVGCLTICQLPATRKTHDDLTAVLLPLQSDAAGDSDIHPDADPGQRADPTPMPCTASINRG